MNLGLCVGESRLSSPSPPSPSTPSFLLALQDFHLLNDGFRPVYWGVSLLTPLLFFLSVYRQDVVLQDFHRLNDEFRPVCWGVSLVRFRSPGAPGLPPFRNDGACVGEPRFSHRSIFLSVNRQDVALQDCHLSNDEYRPVCWGVSLVIPPPPPRPPHTYTPPYIFLVNQDVALEDFHLLNDEFRPVCWGVSFLTTESQGNVT